MTYLQKNKAVSLMCTVLLFGYYALNVLQLQQSGRLTSVSVFSLWMTLIVIAIITNIVAVIITFIVFNIISVVRTNEAESEFVDERDKFIDLKGTRNAYAVTGIGVFFAAISLILNQPPLVTFNVLVFAGFSAEIFGDLSRLYLYWKAG